ncbi:ribbon-helix-helix domain-containing protein [Methylobacterium platani]|uniref:CopG family transcriptional regulator n=2 Tax=Methylobacterium platani TaxID=427683 RepID=A0A179SGZ4_9HYPH|nr:ribbon-helix-helix protein, CopG family [Methylobacterium platani]KMO13185.1 CopG family transcriptional regulator [Methylobacterium platani JCM 14648]OAS26138.1 CopG family transcriptional regulator [Methylobacterium platani]
MPGAETISITMTPEQLRAVRESVASGEYASTSEVLRDAVRLWQRQRAEQAERLNAIRARIRRSLDDPRPALTLDQVDAHLEELFAEAEKAEKGARRA